MGEIDEVSLMLGSMTSSIKDIQKDVGEIKIDVKSLLMFRAKVIGFGTLGGFFGGAIAWTIVNHVVSLFV